MNNCPSLDTLLTSHAMMKEFKIKNMFPTYEQDLDLVDDLFDDELFDFSIREEFDYETMQLLEDY